MTDRPSLHDARQAFIEKHGGIESARRYMFDRGDKQVPSGYFIFPDGARLDEHVWGENFPPPRDKVQRLTLIRAYQQIMLQEAEQAFRDCRNMIDAHFDPDFSGLYCGPPFTGSRQDALNELKRRRNAIYNAKYALEQTQLTLDAILKPPAKAKRDAALDQEIADQQQKFVDELRQITI